ncbi:serine hydrolase domain-containing protein [Oryzibacter oryziterrae]|uniref:serine hydrolase domain-containing protein n=1 Tax=Oryzibacter oryziterrae TaxID=2766474 RepID=UPI001F33E0BD|nr:serine hydrolase domain-containing protein [Oryzibacter oryziterrae]
MTVSAARIDAVIDRYLGPKIVGTNILVAERGEIVYARAAGFLDREAGRPMAPRTLFRLASVTKPMVSVAALSLVESGIIALDDPVTRFLPNFRPRLKDGREPVITIHHLMTHTSGLTYDLGHGRVDKPASGGLDDATLTMAENLERVAALPLAFAPGASWCYSVGIDVLGGLLEAATGESLPDIVRSRVTAPLGMADTDFWPLAPDRLAIPYADGSTPPHVMGEMERVPWNDGFAVFSPARSFRRDVFPSGGAGMVGTAEDFIVFLEALRKGGAPLLSAASLPLLSDVHTKGIETERPGMGYSHGWSIIHDPKAGMAPFNPGTWSWGGIYGHQWLVDPTAEISAVIFSNTAMEGCTGQYPLDVRDAIFAR